jgi:acyl-coenzyme A synthetase/AMP-(fatty) acid ligase
MVRWPDRTTPPELADRYRRNGHWDDQTLGRLLDGYLRAEPELEFRIWSDTRPYRGTYREVHELSRRVAGGLQAGGVKPGDVVAFQMPNWVEAAATFWGLSLLGAVIVPIVHFYGPHEVGFILRESGARLHLSADRFGHANYLDALDAVLPDTPDVEAVIVAGDDEGRHTPFSTLLDADPLDEPIVVDPASPAFIA